VTLGVNAAYDGLQLYLKEIKPGIIDGFTTEQRFFLFLAPFELNHVEAKKPSETDPHSPGIYHLCSSKILMPYERHLDSKRDVY
jgi:predicted metalloendopeptidase